MKTLTAYAALSFAVTTGLLTVLHYALDIVGVSAEWLAQWGPHGPPMALNTGLAVVAMAVAIWCWPRKENKQTKSP